MRRSKKTKFFESTLLVWFQKSGRILPWRKKNISAYEVWVSEIMLQQTQVQRVEKYYESFLKRFPTIESLGKADWEEFLPYYEGLGYYNRGRSMLKTAHVIMSEYGGVFPRDTKELLKLPGVGEYTANAIRVFAFGEKTLAFDTNWKRVAGRFFEGSKDAHVDQEEMEKVFALSESENLNGAVMDFASDVCVKKPRCGECPLARYCTYEKEKGKREKVLVIQKTKTKKAEKVRAVVTLHKDHKQYYSLEKNTYKSFVMPAGVTTRAEIKKHFEETYGLKVSVRPPHKKEIRANTQILHINAQILAGEHIFFSHPSTQV